MNYNPLAPLGGAGVKYRMADLERLTGLTRPAIRAMIQRGEFPEGVRAGIRVRVWPEQQVRDWIVAREAEARQ